MRPRLLFTGLLWCGIVALVGCGSSLQPSGHGGGGVPSGGGGAAGARATGGVPGAGAGGLPGAGGGYGAGGLPGAGGMRGTAAVSGQAGGTPGSGGLHGSGGAPGAGGVRGTGGAAPVACGNTICTADEFCCDPLCSTCAPAGGLCALGCPVDGGSTGACASLEAQYDQALAAARACTPGASGACATMLPAALRGSECGCNLVYVNDGAQASAIYQSWRSLGCERLVLCLDCGDPPRRSGACVASDGGTGACQFVPLAGG